MGVSESASAMSLYSFSALSSLKYERLVIEQSEACGAQIRLKSVLVTPLMLKRTNNIHRSEAGEDTGYYARGDEHRRIH